MDGYTLYQDQNQEVVRIDRQASTQKALIRALDMAVPAGARVLAVVIVSGSTIEARPSLQIV